MEIALYRQMSGQVDLSLESSLEFKKEIVINQRLKMNYNYWFIFLKKKIHQIEKCIFSFGRIFFYLELMVVLLKLWLLHKFRVKSCLAEPNFYFGSSAVLVDFWSNCEDTLLLLSEILKQKINIILILVVVV